MPQITRPVTIPTKRHAKIGEDRLPAVPERGMPAAPQGQEGQLPSAAGAKLGNRTMPASILTVLLTIWLVAVAALVSYRLLTERAATAGLLRLTPDGPVDPERVQMLIGTLAAAATYAGLALSTAGQSENPITALPEVPDSVLVLLGGSQFLYLGGKLTRRIVQGGKP
jgi:hypothetical protein